MFDRLIKIIGEENLNKISSKKILLVGVGGVGSAALEALVRNGFNNITVIDMDIIDISNLNRQLITNSDNIGSPKVKEAVLRAKTIRKDILIEGIEKMLKEDDIEELLDNNYDYIIDACDDVNVKYSLIEKTLKKDTKLITCLGTAKKLDITKLSITSIDKTNYDPLARILRHKLKVNHINPKKIMVVSSTEAPIKSEGLGSASFVPNAAGLLCVSYIFNDIIKN